MKSRNAPDTFDCPHCGAPVRAGAKVCRECGSDDSTGWASSEEIDYRSVDLPQGYRSDEDHESTALPPTGRPLWLVITALLLVVLMIAAIGLRFW